MITENKALELASSISSFVKQIKPTNNPRDDAVIKGLPEWIIEDLENSAPMLRTIPELLDVLETLIYLDERNELTSYHWITTMASAKKLVAKAKGKQSRGKLQRNLVAQPNIKL